MFTRKNFSLTSKVKFCGFWFLFLHLISGNLNPRLLPCTFVVRFDYGNFIFSTRRLKIHTGSFRNLFTCFRKQEVISDGSLEAIKEIVTALRSNVQIIGHAWLLRVGGAVHQGVVQELFIAIKKGDIDTVRALLDAGWRIESSQALYMYLARMETPLIPYSIQRLVLDDVGDVPVELVATDVIGLMKQELPEKQLQLVSELLHLLDTVIKFSPADELRGNTLPISMLPLFFNIDTQHINEWRRIATIFVEMIRLASQLLESTITVRSFLID